MALNSVTADRDSLPARDSVRQILNYLTTFLYYITFNRLLSSTIATLPLCATATVTSKVKTTNATVAMNSGVANAVAATDNAWTLTGGNLAAGFFRKYLLLVDSADTFTVLASTDAATAAGCSFSSPPPAGQCVLGVLTIQNTTNPFVPGTTLLGAAGVTATYQDDIDDSVFLAAIINR